MDEDFFRDHLNDLFDSFKSNSAVKELMKNQQASDAVEFVHKNSKPILFTLSAVAAVFILRKLLGVGGGNNSQEARKRRASKKLKKSRLRSEPGTPSTPLPQKIKIRNAQNSEPVIPADPIEAANQLIDKISSQFKEDYEDAVERFFKLVDIRYAQWKGSEDDEFSEVDSPKSSKLRGSYKEKLNYQYLYFNEHLLKLLMRLDTVETQGDDGLRQRRKDSIKFIQSFCKKLDQYKSKVDELANNGIEF